MSDKSNKPLSTLTPLSQKAMEARKPLPVASLLKAQQEPIHPYDEPGRAASVARPNKPLSNLSSLTSLPHISAPIINLPLSADEAVLQWETDEAKEQSQARLDPSHVPSLLFSGWHTLGDLPLPPPPQNPQPPQDPSEPPRGSDVTPDDPYRGMHEIVRQMTPYTYANVTPASYREPRSQTEQPATPPQIDPGVVHGFKRESIHADFTTPITPINQGESNAMSMIEGSAYQEAQEDAKERLQEEKSQEDRTGQDSATEGGESTATLEAVVGPIFGAIQSLEGKIDQQQEILTGGYTLLDAQGISPARLQRLRSMVQRITSLNDGQLACLDDCISSLEKGMYLQISPPSR